jgi:hypothetical protein
MKDDRTNNATGDAYDPLIAATNFAQHTAARAAELAMAALLVQIGILQGMINAGLVDAKAMRAWLQSLVDQLNPLERLQPYGRCLAQVIERLDAYLAGNRPLKLH